MTVEIGGKTQVEDRDLQEFARQTGEQTESIITLTRQLKRLTWAILWLTALAAFLTGVQAVDIVRRWL